MIRAILRKDVKLLWPLVVLVTTIQSCLEWAWYRYGSFGEDLTAGQLLRPLTFAWFIGTCGLTAAIVLQDSVPTLDQDWLIRPIARLDLCLSKMLLTLGAIVVPMFALDVARALATGFPLAPSFREAALKEVLVAGWLLVPVAALASAAATFIDLLVLGASLIAVYAGGSLVAAVVLGPAICPTCGTGTVWIEHTMQHVGVLVGACIILGLQYLRRRTRLSRGFALIGALTVAWFHLPWGAAFSIESRLAPQPGSGRTVDIALAPRPVDRAGRDAFHSTASRSPSGWTSLLGGAPASPPVRLELPVHIWGMASDELVFVDRTGLKLRDRQGHALYEGINAGMFGQDSLARPNAVTNQAVLIPSGVYQRLAGQGMRLELDFSMTLLVRTARYRLAAQGGTLQSPGVGRCAARVDPSGLTIKVRCRQIGPAPICVSAMLFGPDGRHDPELWDCNPDYRPDLPGFTNVMRFYSLDVPVRDPLGLAQYPVPQPAVFDSYLRVSLYSVRDHFARALVVANTRLDAWR